MYLLIMQFYVLYYIKYGSILITFIRPRYNFDQTQLIFLSVSDIWENGHDGRTVIIYTYIYIHFFYINFLGKIVNLLLVIALLKWVKNILYFKISSEWTANSQCTCFSHNQTNKIQCRCLITRPLKYPNDILNFLLAN